MGGPVEKFIEPLGERVLSIFPVFRDRNEIKIAVNHFLAQAFITNSFFMLGLAWWPFHVLSVLSIALMIIAEWKNGRWVDRFSRGLGWLPGGVASIFQWI